jgi:hypothetical protein
MVSFSCCLHFYYESNTKRKEQHYERIMEMRSQLNRLRFIPRNLWLLTFSRATKDLWACFLRGNSFLIRSNSAHINLRSLITDPYRRCLIAEMKIVTIHNRCVAFDTQHSKQSLSKDRLSHRNHKHFGTVRSVVPQKHTRIQFHAKPGKKTFIRNPRHMNERYRKSNGLALDCKTHISIDDLPLSLAVFFFSASHSK